MDKHKHLSDQIEQCTLYVYKTINKRKTFLDKNIKARHSQYLTYDDEDNKEESLAHLYLDNRKIANLYVSRASKDRSKWERLHSKHYNSFCITLGYKDNCFLSIIKEIANLFGEDHKRKLNNPRYLSCFDIKNNCWDYKIDIYYPKTLLCLCKKVCTSELFKAINDEEEEDSDAYENKDEDSTIPYLTNLKELLPYDLYVDFHRQYLQYYGID